MKPTLVLKAKELAKHARKIADYVAREHERGCCVVPRPVSNPTLVAHGLVKSSRWHILTHEPPRRAVADLYVGSQAEAARITRLLSNIMGGVSLDLLNNQATPADLAAHPRAVVNPSRSKAARARRSATRLARKHSVATPRGFYRQGRMLQRLTRRTAAIRRLADQVERSKFDRAEPRRVSKLRASERAANPAKRRGRVAVRRNPGWKTGDRFKTIMDITVQRASYRKGSTGTITFADTRAPFHLYAVFDDTPHIAPTAISERWIVHANPSRTRASRARRQVRRGKGTHSSRRIHRAERKGDVARLAYVASHRSARLHARRRPNPKRPKTAAQWRAALKANVDDWYADRITHTEFTRRQRALWAAIERQPAKVKAQVLKLIRRAMANAVVPPRLNPRVRIVYNRLLGGWYVVTGPHQTPINGRFDSKGEAQAWLDGRRTANPSLERAREEAKQLARAEGVAMVVVYDPEDEQHHYAPAHAVKQLFPLATIVDTYVSRGAKRVRRTANPKRPVASDKSTAHRGHLITHNRIHDTFHVSRDGHHITSQPTLAAAKRAIDELVMTNPLKHVKPAPGSTLHVTGRRGTRTLTLIEDASVPGWGRLAREMSRRLGDPWVVVGTPKIVAPNRRANPKRRKASPSHRLIGGTAQAGTHYYHGGQLAADGWVEMTRAQWNKIHNDFKGYAEDWTDFGKTFGAGTPSVMGREPGGSVLRPVRIVDAKDLGRRTRNPSRRKAPRSSRSTMGRRKGVRVRASSRPSRLRARGLKPTARARRPNPESSVDRASRTVRKWQDRGPIRVKRKRMKPPPPLKGAAAELGKLHAVTYESNKFDGKKKLYEHEFGDPRPSLVTSPEGKGLYVVGGGFEITPDGIVN